MIHNIQKLVSIVFLSIALPRNSRSSTVSPMTEQSYLPTCGISRLNGYAQHYTALTQQLLAP